MLWVVGVGVLLGVGVVDGVRGQCLERRRAAAAGWERKGRGMRHGWVGGWDGL